MSVAKGAAALVMVLLLVGCSSSPGSDSPNGPAGSPTATSTLANNSDCNAARIGTPGWFPHGLPLPTGTSAIRKLAPTAGFHRAAFIVPMRVARFRRFVGHQWTSAGYVLGRMAVGAKHLAGSFVKPPAGGSFLAQERCGGKASILYLSYAAASPSPSSS